MDNVVQEITTLAMTSPEDVTETIKASNEAFDARCAMELGVADMVVGRLSEEKLAGLRERLEVMKPLISNDRFVHFEHYLEANNAYHEYLVGLTGNEALVNSYRALSMRGLMIRVLRSSEKTSDKVIEDHVRLTESFVRGDLETAKKIIRDHTELAKRRAREAVLEAAGRTA